jgi:hypothetical protein
MKLHLGAARVGIDSGFLASWPSSQVEHVSTRLPDGFERSPNRIVLSQTDYTTNEHVRPDPQHAPYRSCTTNVADPLINHPQLGFIIGFNTSML